MSSTAETAIVLLNLRAKMAWTNAVLCALLVVVALAAVAKADVEDVNLGRRFPRFSSNEVEFLESYYGTTFPEALVGFLTHSHNTGEIVSSWVYDAANQIVFETRSSASSLTTTPVLTAAAVAAAALLAL